MNVIKVGLTQVAIDEVTVQWQAGLEVDADGAPNAYSPPGCSVVGVDNLANAGFPGHYVGADTDTGEKDGIPIVQAEFYPNLDGSPSSIVNPTAGCWLSPTVLRCSTQLFHKTDPRRYVDAMVIRYLSIPRDLYHMPVDPGDVATLTWGSVTVSAIVAEVGPRGRCGEASVASHRALGHDPVNPARPGHLVGIDSGVSVVIYRNSSKGWPRTNEDVAAQVALLRMPVPV